MRKFGVLWCMMMIVVFLVLSCAQKDPIGIKQYNIDVPTADFSIETANLMSGDDYSIGYYNGNIQTDQAKLNWTPSTDSDFLCYKVMKMEGEPEERSLQGFESGNLPANYSTWGDFGGWFVTDEFSYDGNYCARTHEGYYGYEYLSTLITVPQDTDIIIEFWAACVNDGEGRFRINGITYDYWTDYQWEQTYIMLSTGAATNLELEWRYDCGYYGYGLLDNVRILGAGDEYELLTTITDKNTTSITDTMLFQNSHYTYNIASFNHSGGCQQAQLTIKTPRWEAPDNILVNGLSDDVIQVTWNDNTESENSFMVYTYFDDATVWTVIDSEIVNMDVTSLVIDDLNTNEVYKFGVKAIGSYEEDTPLSYSDTFYFNDLTFDPPTNLYGYQNTGLKSVHLEWTDNSNLETGFSIERKINDGSFMEVATTGMNEIEFTDEDTLNFEYGDMIYYRIAAFNDYENIVYTDYSNVFAITISEMNGISEDFEDGIANNWIDDGTGRWQVTNGVYRMTATSDGDGISYYNEQMTDFTYTADMVKNYGDYSIGLYFRGDGIINYGEYQNGYIFVIDPDSEHYSVWKSVNGISTSLISWTNSPYVNGLSQLNNLKVVCAGPNMTFYINDQMLDSITEDTFDSGYVGLWAADSGYDQDDFDNIALTYDTSGCRAGREITPQYSGNYSNSEVSK